MSAKQLVIVPDIVIKVAPNKGKCGLVKGKPDYIQFPRFLMGCCGDERGLAKMEAIRVPEFIDKAFFEKVAIMIKASPYLDWDWYSFQQNIILPNREHIKLNMGLDEFFTNRVCEDLLVVLNNWECDEEEEAQAIEDGYTPVSHRTFFTSKECEF